MAIKIFLKKEYIKYRLSMPAGFTLSVEPYVGNLLYMI